MEQSLTFKPLLSSDALTGIIKPLFSSSWSKLELKSIRSCPLCKLKGLWVYKLACLSFPSYSLDSLTTLFPC
jgi:hypothetical protein